MFGKSPRLADSVVSLVDPGEEVLAAIAVQSKGSGNRRAVGGLLGEAIGARGAKARQEDQEASGLELPNWAALAVTSKRVLILKMNAMGNKATEIISDVPIAEVEGIDVSKTMLRKSVTLSARGGAVVMETHKAAPAESLQDALAQARNGG